MTIPKNTILQSKGLGDTIGDIVESFNLDLSSNYGAIRVNKLKRIATATAPSAYAWAIVNFLGVYVAGIGNLLWKNGGQPSDSFTSIAGTTSSITNSDLKIFNSKLYHSRTSSVYSSSDIDTWASAISSGLSDSPHLMEVFGARCYITDSYCKVRSFNTSDTLTTDGQDYSIDLALSSTWTITSLRKVGNLLWIGLLDTGSGAGKIVSWDGASQIPNSIFDVSAGIMAGCDLDNIFHVIDSFGVLKRYAGNSFIEVARLSKKSKQYFVGANVITNERFIHPNGIQATEAGTILINIRNQNIDDTFEDTIPSGIWEYDKNVGLYHKYSASFSDVEATTYDDFGQQRIRTAGAICMTKPATMTTSDNGSFLCGMTMYNSDAYGTGTNQIKGIFCDDTLNTTLKWGYFVTTKLFGNIQQQWQKCYAIYKKFIDSSSKIIVKYRTVEDTPTTTVITWTDIDRFTSATSLSAYSVGDEVQILQGYGSGQSSHIKEISGSTYILEDNFPTATIGITAIANVSKWIKAGEVTSLDELQYKGLTLALKNSSPFIQFKVCMQFKGNDELNKLQIISNETIKE